ncbi:hypothetical protein PR202_gb29876 [Eleusine coracana subsp. coracana]|uniref:Reverse transcriptase zinc-binding domain-containing protein n=1 Tax=Eleusine coracana subsp. coracana TaxID=191504 RepID=A0AAV5G1N9_ELECO|nr:hypothetical protein PR202_gb29876 [Eleusine coracana subsp. coracana]
MGCCIGDLTPNVISAVLLKTRKTRTVTEALENNTWPSDIQGGLLLIGQYEYFLLSDVIQELGLTQEQDHHSWRFKASGIFSSRSAYQAFFQGLVTFEPWRLIWKTWVQGKCRIFLWLAIRNRCWTADRLQKRGLEHPERCVLCDQEEEMIQHILTSCVFARQFWNKILTPLGFGIAVPSHQDTIFATWWRKSSKRIPKEKRKGYNSVVAMGAWLL